MCRVWPRAERRSHPSVPPRQRQAPGRFSVHAVRDVVRGSLRVVLGELGEASLSLVAILDLERAQMLVTGRVFVPEGDVLGSATSIVTSTGAEAPASTSIESSSSTSGRGQKEFSRPSYGVFVI